MSKLEVCMGVKVTDGIADAKGICNRCGKTNEDDVNYQCLNYVEKGKYPNADWSNVKWPNTLKAPVYPATEFQGRKVSWLLCDFRQEGDRLVYAKDSKYWYFNDELEQG